MHSAECGTISETELLKCPKWSFIWSNEISSLYVYVSFRCCWCQERAEKAGGMMRANKKLVFCTGEAAQPVPNSWTGCASRCFLFSHLVFRALVFFSLVNAFFQHSLTLFQRLSLSYAFCAWGSRHTLAPQINFDALIFFGKKNN